MGALVQVHGAVAAEPAFFSQGEKDIAPGPLIPDECRIVGIERQPMPMLLGFIPVRAMQRFYLFPDVFNALQGEREIPVIPGRDPCNIFRRHEPVEAPGSHANIGGELG